MIYALLLENEKYYVGWTSEDNIQERMNAHINKRQVSWIKKHKFIKIVETFEGDKDIEKEITLKYMRLYGWENVRGGPWTAVNLKAPLEFR